jgi:hypothetical protein
MPVNDNGQEYRTSICKPSKKLPEKYPGCGQRIIWKLPYVAGSRPFDDINFEYQHQCDGVQTSSVESMIQPIEPKEVYSGQDQVKKIIETAQESDNLTMEEAKMLFKILTKLI